MVRLIKTAPPKTQVVGYLHRPRRLGSAGGADYLLGTTCGKNIKQRLALMCERPAVDAGVDLLLLRSYLDALRAWQERYYFESRDAEWAEHAARYVLVRLDSFYTETAFTFQELYDPKSVGIRDTQVKYEALARERPAWLGTALQTWSIARRPGGKKGASYTDDDHRYNPTTLEALAELVECLPTPESFDVVSKLPERVAKWRLNASVQIHPSRLDTDASSAAVRLALEDLVQEDDAFCRDAGRAPSRTLPLYSPTLYSAIRKWMVWVGIIEQRLKTAGLTVPASLFSEEFPPPTMLEAQLRPDMEVLWAGVDNYTRRGGDGRTKTTPFGV